MAGLMMFGKGLSVQERFANFRMDYLDFCNLIGDERYSDRLTYDGRWENNLYQFFSRVIPKVTADLPSPFRMEDIQRVDDTPQHKAVREAFTNAIIHSDLLMDAGILRVEKHDNRLCFRNLTVHFVGFCFISLHFYCYTIYLFLSLEHRRSSLSVGLELRTDGYAYTHYFLSCHNAL